MKRTVFFIPLLSCLAGCVHPASANEGAFPFSELAIRHGGVWASDGYGYVVDATTSPTLYHIMPSACVPHGETEENPMGYFGKATLSTDGQSLHVEGDTDPYVITFKRQSSLPDSCANIAALNPLTTFDAFAEAFGQHYGFFDVRGLDWDSMTEEMRASLTSESSEQDLIERMIGLVSQTKDGHVSISATVDGDEGQFIAYPGPTLRAVQENHKGEGSPMAAFGRQYLRADIEEAILGGKGFDAANERIKYGITAGDIGYLAVMGVGGFTGNSDASPDEELRALDAALDEVLALFELEQVNEVIIDLSVNRGGYDFLGRRIAERFTNERLVPYSKFAADATDRTPQPLMLDGTAKSSFTGRVYVLTSDVTVSAAETLTLSLRAIPGTVHVGATTRGALSDVLTKPLPNGWFVTLSNEVYQDHQGVVWEGKGIAPHHQWQVFDPKNPLTGHMPAVEKTIALIREHRTKGGAT